MTAKRLLIVAVAVLVLLVTACGGKPSGTQGAQISPAAQAPSAAKEQAPPKPKALREVKVTIPSTGTDFLYLVVGEKKGFFAEEGLKVSLEKAAPTTGIQALVAGQFQFSGAVGSGQNAAAKKVPVKVVAIFQSKPAYGFFARKEIQSIKDLKGKKLGITSLGSPAHVLANFVLEKNGVNPETDVTWVAMNTAEQIWPAIVGGAVDAGMVGTKFLIEAKKNANLVDLGIYRDPAAAMASVGLVTTDKLIREEPELVQAMVRGSLKALNFMRTNKVATVEIMAPFMEVPKAAAEQLYDLAIPGFDKNGTMSGDELRQSLKAVAVSLGMKEEISISAVYDLRFAEKVAAQR